MSAGEFEERVVKTNRADKAMTLVREHLAKHFSVAEDAVRLDPSINEAVWAQGRTKPPSKLRVRAARFDEEGESVVEAEPAE
jgi:large subunit ribosomal protein L31e